jgi:hypothetical protein
MSACSKCGSELLEVPGHPSHHCTAPTNDSAFGIGDKVRVRDSDAVGEITHIVARPAAGVFATVYFQAALQSHTYNTDVLEDITRLRDGAIDEVLAESKRAGKPAVPGVERVKPEGVLTVRPDRSAGDAIERMVKAGILTWDGRPVLAAGDEDGAA